MSLFDLQTVFGFGKGAGDSRIQCVLNLSGPRVRFGVVSTNAYASAIIEGKDYEMKCARKKDRPISEPAFVVSDRKAGTVIRLRCTRSESLLHR